MKQTERFYNHVRWFKDAQNEIESEYSRTLADAERFKGSEAYREIKAKADETRAAALKKERQTAYKAFREIFAAMRANVTGRKITPPTQEQLAILQALKMRTSLTADEVKQAANCMSDCPLAVSVLSDLAKDKGLKVHLDTGTLSTSYLMERISSLEYHANAMLDGQSVLTNRKPENEAECLTRWGSFGYELENVGGNLVNRGRINQPLIDSFSSAVNGEAEQ